MIRGRTRQRAAIGDDGRRARVSALAAGSAGLVVATGVAYVLLGALALGSGSRVEAPPRADEVLLTVIAWAGVCLAGWLAAGSILGLLSLLPGTVGDLPPVQPTG